MIGLGVSCGLIDANPLSVQEYRDNAERGNVKNTPAFQFYPNDLLADPEIMHWDMEAVGAYWKLVCYLWVNGGSCELNLKVMGNLFNANRRVTAQKLWDKVKVKFVITDDVITHEGLLQQMQKQKDSRVRRQAAGRQGAQARWSNDGNAMSLPMAKNSPSTSSSISTSISSSTATSVSKNIGPLALDDHDLSEVVAQWVKTNGISEQQLRDDHVAAWQAALKCHGKRACLEYIGKVKATSPGWIISRMNKDAANAAATVERPAVAASDSKQTAGGGKVYDGRDVDWQAVERKYAEQVDQ